MCTQSKMPLVHNYDMQMSTTHTRGFWYKKSQPKSFQCIPQASVCLFYCTFRKQTNSKAQKQPLPRFQPEGRPAVLWTPIFGRNTRKIHLISHTFTGKREFWMASFQCLAKSLAFTIVFFTAVNHNYDHKQQP